MRAKGGVVQGPMPMLIGEDGCDYIVPLKLHNLEDVARELGVDLDEDDE